MEPGYPDLQRYVFFKSKIIISKLWIDQREHCFMEAECIVAKRFSRYLSASRGLFKLLKSDGFKRPDMIGNQDLGNSEFNKRILYFSHLPRRGWNHGDDVGDMVKEAQVKRPADMGQRLCDWAEAHAAQAQVKQPGAAEHFRNCLAYKFPIIGDKPLKALLMEVEWKSTQYGRDNTKSYFVINIDV